MSPDQRREGSGPASFFAAMAALASIEDAVRGAGNPRPGDPPSCEVSSDQVLAALLLLREMRDELATWETDLIETAREAGASWADLARPLGVSSRQAAERRYLRLRPGAPGTTGEQRVRATRDRRAADRAVAAWARENAADLRRLAGQISAVDALPSDARTSLTDALGNDDAAVLVSPLTDTRDHLTADHSDLADRVDTLIRRTDRLRRTTNDGDRPPAE
ncbi:type III effector protein [Streptomyces sp. NPDC087512]|uniref:type III effector protein n=1 Tax=unclassified Streptomyces TaxID=2593676 RepID=UPI0034128CD0